jgi:hypothetical protein
MEAVARRSLASGWRNAPGMTPDVEDFMSDDTDFRDLLADVPPDSAPEPPVRQGRRVSPSRRTIATHNCFFCETSNPKRPPSGNVMVWTPPTQRHLGSDSRCRCGWRDGYSQTSQTGRGAPRIRSISISSRPSGKTRWTGRQTTSRRNILKPARLKARPEIRSASPRAPFGSINLWMNQAKLVRN